jgi:uncharacterized membrane protein YgcG
MKRIVLILILSLVTMAHAGNPQEGDGVAMQNFQNIETQLTRLGIQKDEAMALIEAMNRAHFTEEQMVRATNQLSAADKEGMATGAIRQKINEGIAKGIPPETILEATTRVRNRFEFAMNLAAQLDKKNQVQLGKTLVDCLSAGLTEKDARSIATSLQTRTKNYNTDESPQILRMETMYTVRALSRQGVSSSTTTGLIGAALAQNFDAKAMRTLRASLQNTEMGNIEGMTKQFTSAIAQGVKAKDLQSSSNSANGKGAGTPGTGSGQGNSGTGGSGGGGGNGGGGGRS